MGGGGGEGGGAISSSLDKSNQRRIYPMGTRQLGSESPPWACSPGAGCGARQHPPPFLSCPLRWKPQTPLCVYYSPPTLSQELAHLNLVISYDWQLTPYPPYLRPQLISQLV